MTHALPPRRLKLESAAAAVVLCACLACSGCIVVVAGAAGAGTVGYIRGELSATENARYEKVIDASNEAVRSLGFIKIGEKNDAFTDIITARTAEDKKVEITVEKQADRVTKVSIRIGLFGDEPKSRALLERINSQL